MTIPSTSAGSHTDAADRLKIEVYAEPQISTELDREISKHLFDCFAWRQRSMDYSRMWYGQKPTVTVIGRYDGLLVAHTAIVRRRYLPLEFCPDGVFPDNPLIISLACIGAGIQGVSVREEYRHRKIGIQILNRAMTEAAALGFDLAILHAPHYLEDFYYKLGWRWDSSIAFILDVNNQIAHTQPGNCCMTANLNSYR